MDFLSWLIQFFVMQVLAELVRPKPKMQKPAAVGLKELNAPTVDETRCLPWLVGRAKQDAPNLTGTFDYFAKPRFKRVRTGLTTSYNQPLGYDYYLGMSMTLCAGSGVRLREIWAGSGDKAVKIWSGNAVSGTNINLNYTTYDKSDSDRDYPNGYSGVLEFHSGDTAPSAYLTAKQGAGNVPAWPHATYVVLRGTSTAAGAWVGATGSMLPLAFVIERDPDAATYNPNNVAQPAGALLSNGTDSNAAYVIAELMTDATFWAGEHPDFIDMDSFGQAAAGCSADGHYIGTLIDTQRSTDEVVLEFCRQIGAVLQQNPVTGQHMLKLIRAADTPVLTLDDSNVSEVASFSRNSVDEATNQLTGTYLDRTSIWQKRQLTPQQDLGAIYTAGRVISGTAEYSSITDPVQGAKILARDLRTLSSPLASARLTAIVPKRQRFIPGDLVTWSNERLGITGLRMRITSSRYLKPGDNRCELELIEDVFGSGVNVYAAPKALAYGPETVGYNSPATAVPAAISNNANGMYLLAAPYALTGDNADHALAMAFPPDVNSRAYGLYWYQDESQLYADDRSSINFGAVGTLVGSLDGAAFTPVNVVAAVNASNAAALARAAPGNVYFSIGYGSPSGNIEMFQASGFTLNAGQTQVTLTGITRAIWDTVPQSFAANTPVYVWLDFVIDSQRLQTIVRGDSNQVCEAYEGQSPLGIKALAFNELGDAPLSAGAVYAPGAAAFTVNSKGYRAAAPYGPGNVRLAGMLGGTEASPATGVSVATGGAVSVSWSPRNRLARGLSGWATGDSTAEPNIAHYVSIDYWNGSAWSPVGTASAQPGATSASITVPAGVPRPAKLRVTIAASRYYSAVPDSVYSRYQYWYWTVT